MALHIKSNEGLRSGIRTGSGSDRVAATLRKAMIHCELGSFLTNADPVATASGSDTGVAAFCAKRSQMLAHECGYLPGVDGLPGHRCHRVMTTGKPDHVEREAMFIRLIDHVE